MAMRSGIAMGMHIRKKDDSAGPTKKEIVSRIWWAHYSLERLISALTGRPNIAVRDTCSISLPLPISSDDIEGPVIESRSSDQGKQPLVPSRSKATRTGPVDTSAQQDRSCYTISAEPANSGSYLNSIVRLGEITQSALALYGSNTMDRSWEYVQRKIAQEKDRLDAWASSLPDGLNFSQRSNTIGCRNRREQNTLDILYHSTKILITRPCLCRLDRRIKDQKSNSSDFNQRAALLCISAAKSIASLLPDAVADNIVELYQAGPWWQMVHVIMQALVILLLEVVYESMYFPNDGQEVIPSLKKLFCWLRIMRVNNGMAVRAYSISLPLLKLISTVKTVSVSPRPHAIFWYLCPFILGINCFRGFISDTDLGHDRSYRGR